MAGRNQVPIQDVDLWERELLAAGWTRKTMTIWVAPNGALYRGPYGAWKAMRQAGADETEGEHK